MLQRIQSLYLFIAICLNAAVFSLDLAEIKLNNLYHNFNLFGLTDAESGTQLYAALALPVLCAISIAVSLIIIFMFKKRQLQIKLSKLNLFLQVGFVVAIFLMVESSVATITTTTDFEIEFGPGTFLSIVPLLFLYLAIRAIKKDDALVRAADRIR